MPLGLAVAVAVANANDHKLMGASVVAVPVERPLPTPTPEVPQQGLCLDQGGDYPEVPALAAEFGFTLHLRMRGEEAHAKHHVGARARARRRWVVERTHSWLNRFRRVLTRWEKRPDT